MTADQAMATPVLERLPQCFEHRARELRQVVQEEYAEVPECAGCEQA